MRSPTRRSFLGGAAAIPLVGSAQTTPAFRKRVHPLEGIARENLKIQDVTVTIMSYPLPPERQWFAGSVVAWKSDLCLIEVFTDKGIAGIGETTPYAGPDAIKKIIDEQIRPTLIGQNPFDVEALAAAWSGTGAFAGIDVACWDIIGKAKNTPVYKLLATDIEPEPHLRMYASGGVGYAWYKRPEDLIDEALRYKEEGYTAMKFRIGTEWANSGMTLQKYIPWVRRMRAAVGPDFDLMQESNMRLSLEQCLELAPVLEELKFHWFEEPIRTDRPDSLEGYRKIRAACPHVMVSGGESRVNRFDFKEWIERDGYDIVQPDCNVTGLTEQWHIARIANLRKKYCCPHNWHGGLTTMGNAALVAAIPNRHMLELNQTYNPFKEEIFKDPLVVKKGYMDVHNKPGFGMELKPGIAEKFPYLPGSWNKPNPNLPPLA